MKIPPDQWAALRAAVAADDAELFERTLSEIVRIAVAHERSYQIRCDRARAFERGRQPFFCLDR